MYRSLFVLIIYRQDTEMKKALEKDDIWKENNEVYINEIVAKHFEDQNMLQVCRKLQYKLFIKTPNKRHNGFCVQFSKFGRENT